MTRTIEPHTVTLPDGRILAFYDYSYTRAWAGDFTTTPEPAEVALDEGAYWIAADGTERELTDAELNTLHADDDDAYGAVLAYVEGVEERLQAELARVVKYIAGK